MAFVAAVAVAPNVVKSQPLVADLSTHQVSITSSFAGEDLVLFGVREGGGDIIVVVRGPAQQRTVRRKERVAGIWMNRTAMTLGDVPGYYAVAATAPLEQIASAAFLDENQIGPARLIFEVSNTSGAEDYRAFHAALVRAKQRDGLFTAASGAVTDVGASLFRTEFHLPAGAPVGTYSAVVYLLRDGEVVAFDSASLLVTKAGLGRAVYDYAHDQPAAYGLLAVVLALIGGWSASLAYRRG